MYASQKLLKRSNLLLAIISLTTKTGSCSMKKFRQVSTTGKPRLWNLYHPRLILSRNQAPRAQITSIVERNLTNHNQQMDSWVLVKRKERINSSKMTKIMRRNSKFWTTRRQNSNFWRWNTKSWSIRKYRNLTQLSSPWTVTRSRASNPSKESIAWSKFPPIRSSLPSKH